MKFKYAHTRNGFSLVELMLVIAIIGMLSQMATTSYRAFTIKAKQTQGLVMLKSIYSLSEAYSEAKVEWEDETLIALLVGGDMHTGLYQHTVATGDNRLVINDQSSGDSCVVAGSPLGYRPNNCTKANYWVWYHPQTYTLWAFEGGSSDEPRVSQGCPILQDIQFQNTLTGQVSQISDGVTCKETSDEVFDAALPVFQAKWTDSSSFALLEIVMSTFLGT